MLMRTIRLDEINDGDVGVILMWTGIELDRVNALLDPASSFLELSSLAGHEVYPDPLPGAGLVTGIGTFIRKGLYG